MSLNAIAVFSGTERPAALSLKELLVMIGFVVVFASPWASRGATVQNELPQLGDEMAISLGNSVDLSAWLGRMADQQLLQALDGNMDSSLLESWLGLMCDPDLVQSLVMMEDRQPLYQWLELMTDTRIVSAIGEPGNAVAARDWTGGMTDPMVVSTIVYSEDIGMMNRWAQVMGNKDGLRRILDGMGPDEISSLMGSMSSSMETIMAVFGSPIDGQAGNK